MARNSMEQLVAIWSRENPVFSVHRQYAQDINSASIYECGIMLFLGGMGSCVFFPLPDLSLLTNCCTFMHSNM